MAGIALPRPPARGLHTLSAPPTLRRTGRRRGLTGPARVLVAHGESGRRATVRSCLEAASLQVVAEARDGAEAIALTASHRPSIVVLDNDLPLREGIDALPRIRRLVPHAIIVLAAEPGSQAAGLARARGADEVIAPDAHPASVLEAVRVHLTIVV